MLDRYARRLIDPPLNQIGAGLAARGYTANGVTMIGLALGLFAALLIAVGAPMLALVPLLASRIAEVWTVLLRAPPKRPTLAGIWILRQIFCFMARSLWLLFCLTQPGMGPLVRSCSRRFTSTELAF